MGDPGGSGSAGSVINYGSIQPVRFGPLARFGPTGSVSTSGSVRPFGLLIPVRPVPLHPVSVSGSRFGSEA